VSNLPSHLRASERRANLAKPRPLGSLGQSPVRPSINSRRIPAWPAWRPEPSIALVAIFLSLPMVGWMRFRGMAWRPTSEMVAATVVAAILQIVALRIGLVPRSDAIQGECGIACLAMLTVMLFRLNLYAGAGHDDLPSITFVETKVTSDPGVLSAISQESSQSQRGVGV
jgi:hypothetical protein